MPLYKQNSSWGCRAPPELELERPERWGYQLERLEQQLRGRGAGRGGQAGGRRGAARAAGQSDADRAAGVGKGVGTAGPEKGVGAAENFFLPEKERWRCVMGCCVHALRFVLCTSYL